MNGSDGLGVLARESRETTAKVEKKRKRSGTLPSRTENRHSKASKKQRLQDNSFTNHDDEEGLDLRRHSRLNSADGARSLGNYAVPVCKDYGERPLWESTPSSSQSISDSLSPNESSPSSPSSSPPQLMMGQVKSRSSIDMSMVEKIDISDAYTMSVGVDAVEAAAVLTLLKRS